MGIASLGKIEAEVTLDVLSARARAAEERKKAYLAQAAASAAPHLQSHERWHSGDEMAARGRTTGGRYGKIDVLGQ